jgi:molybdopterin molybdotransferase
MPTELITVREARERVLRAARPLDHERVRLEEALDRVLGQDVRALYDVPPFPSSAMDGYAVTAGATGRRLTLIGESRAGAPAEQTVTDREALRISTGAAVPAGATAVIRQEDVRAPEDDPRAPHQTIETLASVAAGANIRAAGEAIRAGATILTAGTRLGAAELGAAVAAGAGTLTVTRQPRISVLSTGDELRAVGEHLEPGQIHNSNGPTLAALAKRSGALVATSSILPDDRDATESALGEALDKHHLIIISGGVSVGPHDHVKPALTSLGVNEQFWGVALQPGKPTWFGTIGQKLVFGLPGNPVSAVVTFSLFVRPAIAALLGETEHQRQPAEATLGEPVRRNPQREQALRIRLESRDGRMVAMPNGPQGSHVLTSLLGADALAMIPAGDGELRAGTRVKLEPLPD